MNIIDIIILVVRAVSGVAGMYKGVIASGLATAGLAGAWFGAQALYERVANYALSNKTLMAVLNQYLEPETFFASSAQASANVADVVAGGETAIAEAVNAVSGKFSMIADAFEKNVRGQVFSNLGITSLTDYLDQTIWMAVFQVLAFVLTFLVLYWAATLLVNLLNHVFRFHVLRGFDWLLGGAFGLVRGLVIVVLVLSILPMVTSMVVPDLADTLRAESTLWPFVGQIDLLGCRAWITKLIGA